MGDQLTYQVAAVEITDRCPCSCRGCFSGKSGKDMGYDEFERIVDKLPRTITRLEISGGEPFINPELPEMCAYSSTALVSPQIFTSGAVWDRQLVEEISKHIDAIKVTIKYPDGRDDWFKLSTGAFNKATELLGLCRELNIKTFVQWVAERANIGCYQQMKGLASKLGAELLVYRLIPFDGDTTRAITRDEFFKMRVYPPAECPAGVTRFCVKTTGEVTPCIYIRQAHGNILEEPFEEIAKRMQEWRAKQGRSYQECIAYGLATQKSA